MMSCIMPRGQITEQYTLPKTIVARSRKAPITAFADRTAGRLHGTGGRLFIPAQDGQWQDTETGTVGPLAELAEAWTAEPRPVP